MQGEIQDRKVKAKQTKAEAEKKHDETQNNPVLL